jgi:membrane-associated phospholipid phosphatase
MTTPEVPGRTPSVEARLAGRLAAGTPPRGAPARTAAVRALEELGQLDVAIYRTIAETPTPTLDRPLRRLSDAADRSKLWLGIAAATAAVGGHTGRRAAATGLVAVGLDSALVNIGFKLAARRKRPDRDAARVPEDRRAPMPHSASFPSGHAASAFAFATGVAQSRPPAAAPLLVLAGAVGYSRVHTGVHYPGDVVIGSLIGATVGRLVGSGVSRFVAGRRWAVRHPRQASA